MHPIDCILAAAGMLCCGLAGCSVNSGGIKCTHGLQARVAGGHHATAGRGRGEAAKSVTCKQDLIGEVGTTAHCEVVVSATNSFEPIVTVTASTARRSTTR